MNGRMRRAFAGAGAAVALVVAAQACGAFTGQESGSANDKDGATAADATGEADGATSTDASRAELDGTVAETDGGAGDGGSSGNDAGPSKDSGAGADASTVGVMFVTSQRFQITSVADGDSKCKAAADAVQGLANRKWAAWLSDDVTAAYVHVSPGMMTTYVRPDGLLIGSLTDIVNGTPLANAPSVTEQLTQYDCAANGVWTGTSAEGAVSATCMSWQDVGGAGNGEVGACNVTSGMWTAVGQSACGSTLGVYCFEQR